MDRGPRRRALKSAVRRAASGAPNSVAVVAATVAFLTFALVFIALMPKLEGRSAPAAQVLIASSSYSSQATVTAENPVLGYRLTLPDGYRRSASVVAPGTGTFVGRDIYTTLSKAQERSSCTEEHDTGMPSLDAVNAFMVEVTLNISGASAYDWARTAPFSRRTTIVAVTIGQVDGARVLEDGKTSAVAIRANDRIYRIRPLLGPSIHPLDDIAASFTALAPPPRPALTSTQGPRDAASQLASRLASAFAVRDTSAVAAFMSNCLLAVAPMIDGKPVGTALNIPVTSFVSALRGAFGRGELTVSVDPQVQSKSQPGGERFFVRSIWTDAVGARQVDLFLDGAVDGSWQWTQASLYFLSTEVKRGCIPYRSPWTMEAASC